jgi:uncharacterized cupredoxin-like copper-binding protein
VAFAAALVTTGTAYAVAEAGPNQTPVGPGLVTIDVGIDQSRFDLGTLRVRQGTVVRFVVHNNDPIDHELIVGDARVHAAHRVGSERTHPPIPGEVSVPPLADALTFYDFEATGTVVYACHLPGHEAYGMRGEIQVE